MARSGSNLTDICQTAYIALPTTVKEDERGGENQGSRVMIFPLL